MLFLFRLLKPSISSWIEINIPFQLIQDKKIKCVYDYVIFVLSFLEYFPAKATRFEGLIMDVANMAEDILEISVTL